MSIRGPDFGQYLHDILAYGPHKNQTAASKAIGISAPLFNMILKGVRRKPTWEVGAKIIREHMRVMGEIHAEVHK